MSHNKKVYSKKSLIKAYTKAAKHGRKKPANREKNYGITHIPYKLTIADLLPF